MNYKYMDLAFLEAEKAFALNEIPVGAVIVKNDKIIAKSHNLKEFYKCCTKHAEINAINIASEKLNNWRLLDCDLYITLDPCPMCASAIKQSRIKNVYSACNNSDPNNSLIIKEIFLSNNINPCVNFVSNIDCVRTKNLLNRFFLNKRNK